ncbi:unnamed protein product [Hymenolepis diminuta]|uniref:RT_RNaseH_2 domain-containing protein n=1 Tax=Hymenolepis diminuta TaxID=6216 RepID=A0A0R3SCJ3_HYMDI|nr:unnamed protein product [Hymenolepis diminuta]
MQVLSTSIKFFGSIFDSTGRCLNPNETRVIAKNPALENLRSLRSFLGPISYYNSFLPALHKHRGPLNQLLHKDTPWEWSPACEEAFEKLKSMLNSELLLTHYDPSLPMVLTSGYGIGAVLSHTFPDDSEKSDRPYLPYSHTGVLQATIDRTHQNPSVPPAIEWTGRKIRQHAQERLTKSERRGNNGRSVSEFPAGIQINLASCNRREIPGRGVNGSKVESGTQSDAAEENPTGLEERNCDYRKGDGSMIYDVGVGKDTWVRHHNQLRRRLAEPTTDERYLSLYSLLDTFNLTHVLLSRSQITDQAMVRISIRPSRLQVDPSSNTYK